MQTEPGMSAPASVPPTGAGAAAAPTRSKLPPALRAVRPKQWVKNVLVFAAPAAAGSIIHPGVLWHTLVAAVCFILISSAVYLINDSRDVVEDRLHPKKRYRPIAAGDLSVTAALILAAVCAVVSLGVALLVINWELALVLGLYIGSQILYSMFLKHQPVIDLAMVASGFLLRAIAGGVASAIPLSQWFVLVAAFGSLFMVGGKRYSEIVALGPDAGTRRSLAAYTPGYLRFIWEMSCAVVIVAYSLWAFDHHGRAAIWAQLSIAPFVLALLRYARDIDSSGAGEPEDVVLGDRVLQVFGLCFVVFVALAVFL